MSEKTRVKFYRFPEGDLVAVFFDIPYTVDLPFLRNGTPRFVMSYQHIGQHGAFDMELTRELSQAFMLEEDVRELHEELTAIGYDLMPC